MGRQWNAPIYTFTVLEQILNPNQLLTELDAVEPLSGVMVLAATNRIDLLDPAVLSPQRLGVHIYVPLPDDEGRKEILRIHLKGTALERGLSLDEILEELAYQTEGFSGAELEALCQEAKLVAVQSVNYRQAVPVGRAHFHQALHKVAQSRLSLERAEAAT